MGELETYFRVIYDPGDLVEIRPLPVKFGTRRWVKAEKIAELTEALKRENENGANLYAGMLPRTKVGVGSEEHCLAGRVVWADIDGGATPEAVYSTALAMDLPEPTMVINSGHGVHLFWRLAGKVEPKAILSMLRGLVQMFGSDPSVADVARIMRLPGFKNWKPPIADCSIWKLNDGHEVCPDEMQWKLPVIAPPKKVERGQAILQSEETVLERARKYLAMIPGTSPGGRTKNAFKAATVLLIDYELPWSDAVELLYGWDSGNKPPIQSDSAYPDNELEKIMENAMRYGKHQPGQIRDKPMTDDKPRVKISTPSEAEVGTMEANMRAELSAQQAGKLVTIPMPWQNLSRMSKALRPGTAVVIAGPIKSGKSYIAINLVDHLDNLGHSWTYLPLEDNKQDFTWRQLAVKTNDYRMTDDDPATVVWRQDALSLYGEEINRMSRCVSENPRIGHKDKNGNTVVPRVDPGMVIEWCRAAARKSRVVFIDPLSQIEFCGRSPWEQEADFVRTILAIAKDTGATIVMVAHTVKRPGKSAGQSITAEDVQGSAMFTRLCQTVILVDGHEPRDSIIYGGSDREIVSHNRTIVVAAARNGPGTRSSYAFNQGHDGPLFEELGMICPRRGKR